MSKKQNIKNLVEAHKELDNPNIEINKVIRKNLGIGGFLAFASLLVFLLNLGIISWFGSGILFMFMFPFLQTGLLAFIQKSQQNKVITDQIKKEMDKIEKK